MGFQYCWRGHKSNCANPTRLPLLSKWRSFQQSEDVTELNLTKLSSGSSRLWGGPHMEGSDMSPDILFCTAWLQLQHVTHNPDHHTTVTQRLVCVPVPQLCKGEMKTRPTLSQWGSAIIRFVSWDTAKGRKLGFIICFFQLWHFSTLRTTQRYLEPDKP